LGIAYAYTYPEDVAHLFVDNAAHFEDTERIAITKDYFPDLSPQADGGHLQQVWDMANRFFVYFPWFKNDEAHRVSATAPPFNVINTAAMEFLQAGPNYAAAYRAAFEHEKAENFAKVTVPTTLFRWKGAILLKYIDQLIASGLNDNVTVIETEAAMVARYQGIVDRMKVCLTSKPQ
jgi:pimeloyl-ACP methyl ester carboxylesterase